MDKKIAIYGAGGHGKVVADIAKTLDFDPFFVDDGDNEWMSFDRFLQYHSNHDVSMALGVGDNITRKEIYNRLTEYDISITTLIHPSAIIAPGVNIGTGTVVMPGVIINTQSQIGNGVIINTAAVIDHECTISDFVHLSPRATLAGGVKVGEKTHIGLGASIIQNIKIGTESVIGAGTVVIEDLPSRITAVGIPARVVKGDA